jgi:ATP-dependent protease ClpP protease subunit
MSAAFTEKQNYRGSDVHEYGLDRDEFLIYLQGVEEWTAGEEEGEPGVEYRMANRFIKNLDMLSGINPEKPITVSMKTCGGDWAEGMAMYDAIIAAPNPVTIINYSHARSMSSIIFQAANKRIMMPHSTFMFHEGTLASAGSWKSVMSDIEFVKHADDQMHNVYINAMKRTPHGKMKTWSRKRIKEWLKDQMDRKEDVYLLAGDAIKYGFADEIFTDWHSVTQYTDWQLERK